MKRPVLLMVLGTLGLGLGLGGLGGRHVASARNPGKVSVPTSACPDPTERPPKGLVQAGATTVKVRNFATLLRFVEHFNEVPPDLTRELERLDVAGLKDLITSLQPAPADRDPTAQQARLILLHQAIGELFRRGGERALEWAAALDVTAGRRTVLGQLLEFAAHDTPELAMPWIDRFRDQYGKEATLYVTNQAVIGAIERGAEDLIRVWELFKINIADGSFSAGNFPAGFDFRRLITALPSASVNSRAVTYWAALDRDAAWAGVKELIDTQGIGTGYFSSLFVGVTAMEGNREAARWIASKLDDLPDSLRENAIWSLVQQPQSRQAETLKVLMAALPQDSDRVVLASRVVSPYLNEAEGNVALEALGSQAARVAAITAVAKIYRKVAQNASDPNSNKVRGFFEATMQQFQFSPAAREQVAAALASEPR